MRVYKRSNVDYPDCKLAVMKERRKERTDKPSGRISGGRGIYWTINPNISFDDLRNMLANP